MKLEKLEDRKQAWNYIFIINAGISLISGNILIDGGDVNANDYNLLKLSRFIFRSDVKR